MFKICVFVALIAAVLSAPAPEAKPAPKPKPSTAYYIPTAYAAPVLSYSADLVAPVVYADEYYEPLAYYPAYAAPLVETVVV